MGFFLLLGFVCVCLFIVANGSKLEVRFARGNLPVYLKPGSELSFA